jgi:enoyl-CoA hydratase/carnithine racemase
MRTPVIFETKDSIATITLNRPDRRNSLNQELLTEFYNALEKASDNDEVKVVIITGNGKSFCSGIDLASLSTDNLFDPRGDGIDLPDIFNACKKPIIGAVNGHAITGGFEIALNCDFLIASEKASFADTHAKVGIHPGWGMTQLLQNAVGTRMAKQISFTCEFITASKAFEIGLVNEIVPHEMLMIRAKQIAGQICSVNQDLLPVIKNLIEYQEGATFLDSYKYERKGFSEFIKKHLK